MRNISFLGCRTDKEKETSGVPDVPNSGRVVELEYASISDRKIRGQLRNPSDIEKTVRRCSASRKIPESFVTHLADLIFDLYVQLRVMGIDKRAAYAGNCAVYCSAKEGQQRHKDPSARPQRQSVQGSGQGAVQEGLQEGALTYIRTLLLSPLDALVHQFIS